MENLLDFLKFYLVNNMIIEVEQPVFLLDKNNPMIVSYKNEEGDNWQSIIVSTYLNGFPTLNQGDILYKYKDNRGYVRLNQ